MAKRTNKREATRRTKNSAEKTRAIPVHAPSPVQEFVSPPPPPPPATYKELIESHKLIVEHVMVGEESRICARRGNIAVIAFVTPGTLSSQAWASKGKKLHALMSHHIEAPDRAEWFNKRLADLLGAQGAAHALDLYKSKKLEPEPAKAASLVSDGVIWPDAFATATGTVPF